MKTKLLFIALFLCLSVYQFLSFSVALAAEKKIELIPPKTQIEIPGLEFEKDIGKLVETDAEGRRYLNLPWIAQYIGAFFNFFIGAIAIIAVVMIMWGGFLWLTAAGSGSQIGVAKTKISNALIGLVLALGSFLILNTVNPTLVKLKSIRVQWIGPEYQTLAQEILQKSNRDGSTCKVTLTATTKGFFSGQTGEFEGVLLESSNGEWPCHNFCKGKGGAKAFVPKDEKWSCCVCQEKVQGWVSPSSKELANKILGLGNEGKITIIATSTGSLVNPPFPKKNLEDWAQGHPTSTSEASIIGENNYSNTVVPSDSMLAAIYDAAQVSKFQINSLVGGKHSNNSRHYKGLAVDLQCAPSFAEDEPKIRKIFEKFGGEWCMENKEVKFECNYDKQFTCKTGLIHVQF